MKYIHANYHIFDMFSSELSMLSRINRESKKRRLRLIKRRLLLKKIINILILKL